MNQENALALTDIRKTYPGVVALDKVSIGFRKGEVHAICGENGAGKSTLIKVVAGVIAPDSGSIQLSGQSFSKLTPRLSKQQGVSVVYQEHNLFEHLSVAENIFLGEKGKSRTSVDFSLLRRRTLELYRMFNMEIDPDRWVSKLSVAQKQIVEILKAVSKNAGILILDEPTAPLTVEETEHLFEIIRHLKSQGVTVIYISHRLDEVFSICDRVSILRDGQYIATQDICSTSKEELIRLMVGRELKEVFPPRGETGSSLALEAEHISGNGLEDLSFSLHKGEILGFAGLVGAGRTELMRLIYGADKRTGGVIRLSGQEVRIRKTADALHNGIGLIPEDRKLQGCFLKMSIKWNIAISNLRGISKNLVVNRKQERDQAAEYIRRLKIKTPSMDQKVGNLSGGNQQKVVLAKVLAAKSDVIIFDEPTRGIDVGARSEIYFLMRELAAQGKSIIMISSDMEELLGMSDRIIVLHERKKSGELQQSEFSQERILRLASDETATA